MLFRSQRTDDLAYVQFGDGRSIAFDLVADPTWRTTCDDPARLLAAAQEMLAWRMQMTERTHTGFLAANGGSGRWPDGVPWRG